MFTVAILQDIIKEEAKISLNKISANIIKNKQNASGKTIQSLRDEVKGDNLAIYGRDKFSELETGTPPNSGVTSDIIYNWSKIKPIPFKNDKARFWFSKSSSKKIDEKGTLLFRKGGRKDVYTSEVEPLETRLTQRITDQIMTTKLIDE